jgi:3-deoxy-manno-octulosonate cytidylyltransferase (CMP-KDO synthetase)
MPHNDEAAVIIPARYGSTRLPAKALAPIGKTPMISRVLARARLARLPTKVLVATDDKRISDAINDPSAVRMTSPDHPSGSDRIAEVAANLTEDIIVNVQGDLPLLDPSWVDSLILKLRADPTLGMATLAVPVTTEEELTNPNVVKIVCDSRDRALYFSRAAIPHRRDGGPLTALHHVGIYAYRRQTLTEFARLEPTPLELAEKLEQLRALENGIAIGVVTVDGPAPMEVDTLEDLERVREMIAAAENRS